MDRAAAYSFPTSQPVDAAGDALDGRLAQAADVGRAIFPPADPHAPLRPWTYDECLETVTRQIERNHRPGGQGPTRATRAAIRRAYAAGEGSYRALARRFGCSRTAVFNAVHQETAA